MVGAFQRAGIRDSLQPAAGGGDPDKCRGAKGQKGQAGKGEGRNLGDTAPAGGREPPCLCGEAPEDVRRKVQDQALFLSAADRRSVSVREARIMKRI